jgi:hypothetical protein
MNETKLPLKWESDGFELEQVFREGDWAIYSQSKWGKVITWEVVRITHLPAATMPNGKVVGPREKYPSPSDWGKKAWSVISLARAHEKLRQCNNTSTPSTCPDGLSLPHPQGEGDTVKPNC